MLDLLRFIPEQFLTHLELPLWGLGIGVMVHLFGRKRNLPWFFAGTLVGALILFL